MNYSLEVTTDALNSFTLRALDQDHSRWKLVRSFKGDEFSDACRQAMVIRDAERHSTGARPVVRVRRHAGAGADGEKQPARTELIMQRLKYRGE